MHGVCTGYVRGMHGVCTGIERETHFARACVLPCIVHHNASIACINANIMCIMYTNYVHHVRYVRTIRHRVRKRACVFVQLSFNAGAALELEQIQSCGLLPPVEKA